MRIFIAGATGVLGRQLVRRFTDVGHEVVGLARSDANAEVIRALGGRSARADLFDLDSLTQAAEGADVVIHAATAIPAGAGMRFRKGWKANDRIRRQGTRILTQAAAAVGAGAYLQQSVAWVVRTAPGGPAYDEDTPPDPPELLRSAVDGERIARSAGAAHGFRVGVLRGGSFYGPEASRSMAALVRERRMPVVGAGTQLVAPIHEADVARAFLVAAESDAEGTWHVVDDEPVPYATLLRHFASAMEAPEPRRIPRWLGRLVLGRHVLESLTTSMNTSNARARRELGWVPRFPTYRDGMAATVWAREGARRAAEGPEG